MQKNVTRFETLQAVTGILQLTQGYAPHILHHNIPQNLIQALNIRIHE